PGLAPGVARIRNYGEGWFARGGPGKRADPRPCRRRARGTRHRASRPRSGARDAGAGVRSPQRGCTPMSGLWRLTLIEFKLFLREPLSLIFAFGFPFFMLFVLAGVFGNDVDPTDEENMRVWRGV